MTLANARIVYCPYCGTKKELMQLASGNTFRAQLWSDNKQIAPMLPKVSPVQRCPSCKKYYFHYKQKHNTGNDYSFNLGELSYQEWKEAYSQFLGERESTDKHLRIIDDDFITMRFELIHSYNDFYYRNHEASLSREEYAFIQGIMKDFIDTFDWSTVENPLLKAEFYREADMMMECAEVLSTMEYANLDDLEKLIFDGIKERMESGNTQVFEIKYR
jgi:hypothetical protein